MEEGGKQRRNEKAINTLGRNIKKYRKAQKLKISDLANLAEMDYSQIGRMERGVVNSNVSMIFEIAKALKIEPGKLLEE